MAKRADPQPRTVEVDERWIGTWVNLGLTELKHYLERHAGFAAYCATHNQPNPYTEE